MSCDTALPNLRGLPGPVVITASLTTSALRQNANRAHGFVPPARSAPCGVPSPCAPQAHDILLPPWVEWRYGCKHDNAGPVVTLRTVPALGWFSGFSAAQPRRGSEAVVGGRGWPRASSAGKQQWHRRLGRERRCCPAAQERRGAQGVRGEPDLAPEGTGLACFVYFVDCNLLQ